MNASFLKELTAHFHPPLTNPVLIFTLILFIILVAPLLLKKIKVPAVVGFIIAGIAINPHGFNILVKNSAIDLFATIGLLYIMFIAGIELDLNDFKEKKHKSLMFGFLTFSVPILIGFPVCYYMLNYSLTTSILTASMFATHTLVAYPIASKYGVSKNEAVAITVGGTILTDTTVLIILAVIMGSVNGHLDIFFWVRLFVSLFVFSIIEFFLVPRLAKWFFSRPESEKNSHYVLYCSLCFYQPFWRSLPVLNL